MINSRLLAVAAVPALAALLLGATQEGGAAVPGVAAPGAPAPGAPTAGDPYLRGAGDGGYHVQHYGLTLRYQPDSGRIDGRTEITARATQELSAFDLDLSGLTVSSVLVDGRPAAFRRNGTKLRIAPPAPIHRNRVFRAVIGYSGVPKQLTDADNSADGWIEEDDGSVFVAGEPQGAMTWFPCNNHPTDKSTYDFTLTVPDGWTAVANGRLRSQQSSGGQTVFRWHESRPMAAYLATASIGEFQVSQYRAADGLPVYNAVDPDQAADAAPVLARLPEVIDWESRLFGPYPFDAAGAIVTSTPDVDYALETQSRPVYQEAPDMDTLVHETAHQWFGDSVSLTRWKDIWLNEGFATYTEWLWDAAHGGPSTAQRFAQLYALPPGDKLWAYPPADPGDMSRIFGTPSYQRGAMVLEKLHQAVGDPVFSTILHSWTAEHAYGHGTTAEFTALAANLSGQNLDGLFATWLYGHGKPARP